MAEVQSTYPDTSGHAALMDRMYRGQRHIYDLTRRNYLLGRDLLIADLTPPRGGNVLEIGCGTGRNLVMAARRYPEARFFGMDISDEMLASARVATLRMELSDRILYVQGDATGFDPESALGISAFDKIFMSYTLSMIPRWEEAISNALRLLSPGGSLHVVDFGQQEGLPRLFRAILFRWLGWFHVTPRANLHEALERLAGENACTLSFRRLYGGYAYLATIRRPE